MVQLQEVKAELEDAGFALFVISYDPPATLSRAAEELGLDLRLLADVGSAVTSSLGLLNERIAERDATDGVEHDPEEVGVAHPGIFVLDRTGRVTERRFHRHYPIRPSGRTLLENLGVERESTAPTRNRMRGAEVEIEAWTSEASYQKSQQLHVHVQIGPAPDAHIYGSDVNPPLTGLQIDVTGPADLRVEEARFPAPDTVDDPFLDEQLPAYLTETEVVVATAVMEDVGNVTLTVSVRYQACTPELCHPPTTVKLLLLWMVLVRHDLFRFARPTGVDRCGG